MKPEEGETGTLPEIERSGMEIGIALKGAPGSVIKAHRSGKGQERFAKRPYVIGVF